MRNLILIIVGVVICFIGYCGASETISGYTIKNSEGSNSEGLDPSGDWSNPQLWKSFDANKTHASFSVRINQRLPEFNFIIVGLLKGDDFYPSHIRITSAADGKLIQELKAKDHFDNHGEGWWRNNVFADIIEFVDLNNDGYLDLRVLFEAGATGNNWCATYIYKPAQKKFVFNEDISVLSAVVLGESPGQIKTYWRIGWDRQCREYYQVEKDGRLVLLKLEWTETEGGEKNEGGRCYKFTAIPLDKYEIHPGFVFFSTEESVFSKLVRKHVKIIKREELRGNLDGRDRAPGGIPFN